MNHTLRPRHGLIIILASLVAFGPLSIDMYLPSLPIIAEDLAARAGEIKLTITLFLVGFSVGMLLYGPLSDRFGRRWLLLLGIGLYLVATVGCAWALSAEQLLAWRLLQALGGASASVLARAIVRDVYPVGEAAKILSLMHIITMVATIAAPVLGSLLVLWLGWRAIFGFLFLFALLCLLLVYHKVPETLASERRLPSLRQVFGAYYQIATNRRGLSYIGCMGMSFAGMFVYITASPFVYIDYFGVTPQQYALLFGLNIFGIMAMTFVNASMVGRVGPQRMIQFGAGMVLASALWLLCLGWSGWGGLWGIVVGLWVFVAMTGTLSANCIAQLMALFPRQAGAAAGLAVATQFGLGACFSFLVSQFSAVDPLPMVGVIAVAGALCFGAMWLTRAP
ncbi:MAG: Bcr/CflA family multidrug efflux MFS transporter [Neisseriaceae bacterium]|nr:Bcr/CflA family multidrug efflux MFS transporter [Neisseriaceae bacterium]